VPDQRGGYGHVWIRGGWIHWVGGRMTTNERATLDAMQKYGGSFIRLLAQCYIVADPDNRALIRATWAGEWARYAEMAGVAS